MDKAMIVRTARVMMSPSDAGIELRTLPEETIVTRLYPTKGYWYIAYNGDFGYVKDSDLEALTDEFKFSAL